MTKLSVTLIALPLAAVSLGNNLALASPGEAELEAARQEGIQTVLENPGAYGLYTEESILDLNLGGMIIKAGEEGRGGIRRPLRPGNL